MSGTITANTGSRVLLSLGIQGQGRVQEYSQTMNLTYLRGETPSRTGWIPINESEFWEWRHFQDLTKHQNPDSNAAVYMKGPKTIQKTVSEGKRSQRREAESVVSNEMD